MLFAGFRSRYTLVFLAAALVLFGASGLAQQQAGSSGAPAPDAPAIAGKYRVNYVDAQLGQVTGVAVILPGPASPAITSRVAVELRTPATGAAQILTGTARIDGQHLVLDLSSESAAKAQASTAGAHEPPSTIELPGPVQVRLSAGRRSTQAQVIVPGAVTVRLDRTKPVLSGQWEEPASRNGQAGYRTGRPTSAGLVGGQETWTPDPTTTRGIMILDDGGAYKTLPLFHGERFHVAVAFDQEPPIESQWVDLAWSATSGGVTTNRILVRKHEARRDVFVSDPLTVPASNPMQLKTSTEDQAAQIPVVAACPIVQVRRPGARDVDASLVTMNTHTRFVVEVRVPRAQATEETILVRFKGLLSGRTDGLRLRRSGSRGPFELYTHTNIGTLADGVEGEGGPPRTFLIPKPLVELYAEYDIERFEVTDGETLSVSWNTAETRLTVYKSPVDERVANIRARLAALEEMHNGMFTAPGATIEEKKDSDLRLALLKNARAVAEYTPPPVTDSMSRPEAYFASRFDEYNRLSLLETYDLMVSEDLSGWWPLSPSEVHFAIPGVRFHSVNEKDRFFAAFKDGDARWALRKEQGFVEELLDAYRLFTGMTVGGQAVVLGAAVLHMVDGQTAVVDLMGQPVTRQGVMQAALEMGTAITGVTAGTMMAASRMKAGVQLSEMADGPWLPRDPAPVLRAQRAIWKAIANARGTRARMTAAGMSPSVQQAAVLSSLAAATIKEVPAAKGVPPPLPTPSDPPGPPAPMLGPPLPKPVDPPGQPQPLPTLPPVENTPAGPAPKIQRPGDPDYPRRPRIIRPGDADYAPVEPAPAPHIPPGGRDAGTQPLPQSKGSGRGGSIPHTNGDNVVPVMPPDSPWRPSAPETVDAARARVPQRNLEKFERVMDVVERISQVDPRFRNIDRYRVAESARQFLDGNLSPESIATMSMNNWGPRGARVTPAHLSRATNMAFEDASKHVEAGWRQQGFGPRDVDIYDPTPNLNIDPPPPPATPPASTEAPARPRVSMDEFKQQSVDQNVRPKFDQAMQHVEALIAADPRLKNLDRVAVAQSMLTHLDRLTPEEAAVGAINMHANLIGARVTPNQLGRVLGMKSDQASAAVITGWDAFGVKADQVDIFQAAPTVPAVRRPQSKPAPAPRPVSKPPTEPPPPPGSMKVSVAEGRFGRGGKPLPERPADGTFAADRPLWGNRILEPGPEGQRRVRELLERHGFHVAQNEIYADTVNQYVQDMLSDRFNWEAINQADAITIARDGDTPIIEHGHHRVIAALIAHEMTGRPLYTYGNDWIGGKPIIPTVKYTGVMEGGTMKMRGVEPIVWTDEPNPYFPGKAPALAVRSGRKPADLGLSQEDEMLREIRRHSVDTDQPAGSGSGSTPRPQNSAASKRTTAEELNRQITQWRDEAFELRREAPAAEANGQPLLAQELRSLAAEVDQQWRRLADSRPAPQPVGKPTYTPPPGPGFQDHVSWPGTTSDSRGAYLSYRTGPGGRIEITDIQRFGQPAGSSGAMVAAGLRLGGQSRPRVLRMSHIVNQRTLDEMAAGTPLENTVLGTTLRNAISELGGVPVPNSWRTGLETGKHFIEVQVIYRP